MNSVEDTGYQPKKDNSVTGAINSIKQVALIVAHPDDETLWAGGLLLSQPEWEVFIACLCRRGDPDRAPKFYNVLKELHARGIMGDMDDGPDQHPLTGAEVEDRILSLLPQKHFDLVITHSPAGEYTRHRRHEETGAAVIRLWQKQKINTAELWTFAYEDGNRGYYPQPIAGSAIYRVLDETIWRQKYALITQLYGFNAEGWEAHTTPKCEAFKKFVNAASATHWLDEYNKLNESSVIV